MRLERGDVLMERYEVRALIETGAFGDVYRLHHRGWGMDIALKCPRAALYNTKGWSSSFEHECETWVNLSNHPNSVSCCYIRRLGGVPRLFVEYVDGKDLFALISGRKLYRDDATETLLRMLDIAIQFAWGLEHAHREGIIHQDIKTSNVLVSKAGIVKVTDFGLARVWGGEGQEGWGSSDSVQRGPSGCTPSTNPQSSFTYEE